MKTMVYDCFTFFNELDLLEIRLNVLNDEVDRFVIVEARKTFSNLDKPLYFQDNKSRFEKFKDKIIHIVIDDFPPSEDAWQREYYQRNAIKRGLDHCIPEDVILISDLDEIPNPDAILKYKNHKGIKVFKQKMFYYYINDICVSNPYWVNSSTRMLFYGDFVKNQSSAQKIRFLKGYLLSDGGWHFSYLGGPEKIALKIKSISHQEFNSEEYVNVDKIKQRIENNMDLMGRKNLSRYAIIKLDNSFPKYIVDNQARYSHLIGSVNIDFYTRLRLVFNKSFFSIVLFLKQVRNKLLSKY